MNRVKLDVTATLFDDCKTRALADYDEKWSTMLLDPRNGLDRDFCGEIESFLQFGRTYRIIITVEKVEENHELN